MAIVKKFRIKSFKKKEPIISINKVSIAFNKNHQILDNISLDIPKRSNFRATWSQWSREVYTYEYYIWFNKTKLWLNNYKWE